MSVFQSNPLSGNQYASMKDALDSLQQFDALVAYAQGDNATLFDNPDDAALWRKAVWDEVINSGGEACETMFFQQIFGGQEEYIDAKKIYFRYNDDPDNNIYAQENVTGSAAGAATTFTLAKANHSGSGKYSYPVEGYQIYIYRDNQVVTISAAVDKTLDYAHRVTVTPHDANYKISIRKNEKMLVIPVRLTGGLSGPAPGSSLTSQGYTNHVQPYRIRKDWELAIDLMRGYQEVLQWAILFDKDGKEMDAWEPYVKTRAREDFNLAKNLMFFIGNRVTNAALVANRISADYTGFDGYLPSVKNAGGTLLDFYPEVGFDFVVDLEPAMVRNDARKQNKEWLVIESFNFALGMSRRFDERVKTASGQVSFETFKRMGATQEDIKKLGVQSYSYAGHSFHFKQMSALTDTRLAGNGEIKDMAFFLPGTGLRTSKGGSVPAVQFFKPKGMGATHGMEEYNRDKRRVDGWDKLEGHIAETIMSTTHCPHLHMLATPYQSYF